MALSIFLLVWHVSSASEQCGTNNSGPLLLQTAATSSRTKEEMERTTWNWKVLDYDCNGDGVQDCGQWDWGTFSCKNAPVCGHAFQLGDFLMEHSCRCMRCFEDFKGSAQEVATTSRPVQHLFYGHWRNWNQLTDTCAPWLMPKNDEDLRAILSYARYHGYTVRPSGATHSAGALVTDSMDRNVLAVSLAEYRAPGPWEYSLNVQDGKATVIVNAGWSPLQLYQKIRPKGYFLPTQTAGPIFQLGGLINNCVHGGNYRKGFLHQYVISMRVMLHNGTQRVISDSQELRFWRNSYGLLGIVTSIEFELDHRPRFQMYHLRKSVPWTEEEFWSFIKQDASADLPDEVTPSGHPGSRQALMGQFFFNPYEARHGFATTTAVVWKANENATEPNHPFSVPAYIDHAYHMKLNEQVIDEVVTSRRIDGKMNVHVYSDYGNVIRHWGGPKVFPIGLDTNDIFAPNAKLMTDLAISGPGMLLDENKRLMNDGFFANKVPNVVYGAYFLDPKHLWRALNILVDSFAALEHDPVFEWNGPPELRFITVTDDAVLNPVPAGTWAVVEFMSFPIGKSDQGWKSAFKSVQDEWNKLGGKPHIGKFWGFGVDASGLVEPFQAEKACSIYTATQKATFETYRRSVDPENLFAGGDALKLLRSCA